MHRSISVFIGLAWALLGSASAALAQGGVAEAAGRGPQFLVAGGGPSQAPTPVDAAKIPALRRRVALDLVNVSRAEALAELSRVSGLRLVYADGVVPRDGTVRLRAEEITVAAALTEVLLDAGVDVMLAAGGNVVLVKRGEIPAAVVGTISGRVTDAETGQGVAGVDLRVAGTQLGATTDGGGEYMLRGVPPGEQRVTARRIGYRPQTQTVTMVDGQVATLDFALVVQPTQLDEVVTTVTGEQRLRELGHVVGRINADSLVREAPVLSLSDLLTARVPGLQVFQNQGTVGGQVNLRIRGNNSLILSPEPIIVVDGVRYTNRNRPMGGPNVGGPGVREPTSPLNDINVNDIESIEVVKGPSAATLYGSDAANGVLVITTKRGRPGPPRWNLHAKGTTTEISTPEFPDFYWGWRSVGGVPSLTSSCTLSGVASGSCTQDSVTVIPNPLNDPEYTIFGSKPRWEYGVNVSGGRQDLRYYFSGDFEDATGPIQMPRAVTEQLLEERGLTELPEEWREPNVFTKLNLRSNVTAVLGETADLRFNAGYVQSSTRALRPGENPYQQGQNRVTPAAPYGTLSGAPESAFLQTSTEDVNRFLGSATGRWRVLPWLETRGTVGLDLTSSHRNSLSRRGDAPNDFSSANGAVAEDQGRQIATTVELGATATVRRGRMSWRTAAGAQYVRRFTNSLFTYGQDLPPGGSSVEQALTLQARQTYEVDATLGTYLEETVGLNDRLFLTGALRLDGASTFGRDYQTVLYPKLSASWLISEEPFVPRLPGLDELRLRYAFGASGRQPLPTWGQPSYFGGTTVVDGVTVRRVGNAGLGNPNLRPERVREHEFGVDLSALDRRLSLGLTWFRRRTEDQILSFQQPPGLGSFYGNLGLTTQHGFEAELTASILDARAVSWDVSFQHSWQTTYLRELGDAPAARDGRGGYVEGYPLTARFVIPVLGYEDVNGDGVVASSELIRGDTTVFMGQSLPPTSQTLTTVVGFFDRRLRLSALAERRAGHTQINPYRCRGSFSTCRELVDPSTSLEEQFAARKAAVLMPEQGDYIRLREVSVAVMLPTSVTRALRLGSATLSVAARNLALWTDFSGPDPESAGLLWDFELGAVRGNQADGVPLGRSYMVRLDLGL